MFYYSQNQIDLPVESLWVERRLSAFISAISDSLRLCVENSDAARSREELQHVAGNKLVWPPEEDRIRQRAGGGCVARSNEKGVANAISQKTGDASDGKN